MTMIPNLRRRRRLVKASLTCLSYIVKCCENKTERKRSGKGGEREVKEREGCVWVIIAERDSQKSHIRRVGAMDS